MDLVTELGPNITGHVWSRFFDVSADVFSTVLEVDYRVHETDVTCIRAQCVIGAQGPLVAMQIAADIQGQPEGAVATLRAHNGAGQVLDIEGSVVGTKVDFGVSGVKIVLELSHAAWLVIAGNAIVQFERVGGRGGFTLTCNGPNTLGPYLADCEEIRDLTPRRLCGSPSTPIGAQDGFLPCDSFGRVGSRDLGQPTAVTFLNESGGFRFLDWINPDGVPVQQGSLNAGEQITVNTDPSLVWMATDGSGNCQEMIQPAPGQAASWFFGLMALDYNALRIEVKVSL